MFDECHADSYFLGRLLRGPTVTILVGPDKTSYSLPIALLSYYSGYIRRQAEETTSSKKGKAKDVTIDVNFPNSTPALFDTLLEWIYSDGTKMSLSRELIERIEGADAGDCIMHWICVVELASNLEIVGCDELAADKIKKILHPDGLSWKMANRPNLISRTHIRHATTELPRNNLIRNLLADATVTKYMQAKRDTYGRPANTPLPFYLQEEVDNNEKYAADLLAAWGRL